ncbi:hypothetical protein I2W78_13515 [Streptomyces spinoverrucosus]|uniref:hypothetical protein n=1 Tax=Streptomyces spinoverrucosus TaxID=284043 RepID=UPI0018C3EE61|nr:hypothetical protein [Streptomyces spinoverrucosus]MBG0852831.1 hypothetical protein [Streptomyces spinoverrucosus]
MRKLRNVAVLVAALSSIGLVGGTAHADQGKDGKDGDKFHVSQSSQCKSHDLNLDVLGAVGLLNGLLDLNGEGSNGSQNTHLGSTMGCNNSAF